MSERPNTREWPLVVFTLGVQLSCGLALAALVADGHAHVSDVPRLRPLGIAVFPCVAVGILGSLFHLGRPWEAPWSLRNLGQSRLSLEILLTAVFAAVALVYGALWFTDWTGIRAAWGMGTVALGVSAVVSGALIYRVPARPVWNSGWVPASFLGTSLLLGGCASVALGWRGADGVVQRAFLSATVAGCALLTVSAFWMVAALSRLSADPLVRPVPREPAHLLTPWQWVSLGLHVLFAGVLPAALALWMWPVASSAETDPLKTPLVLFAVLSALLGAAFGRRLMYALGPSAPRF